MNVEEKKNTVAPAPIHRADTFQPGSATLMEISDTVDNQRGASKFVLAREGVGNYIPVPICQSP